MVVGLGNAWSRLGWLTGPIFGKELRVSSRRRRNFWLRSIYVLLLTVFIFVVWTSVVASGQSTALQQSQTAVAGKRIVMVTVTFQFVATQLLAVIMLSTAISDEVYHRTLGLLMTTPINSFQVVMGKVLSKLLQLVLLLGITLPVLAIVRVFGGVPWEYLLSSFCITLTAVLLAAALSLLLSIKDRRAYVVIVSAMFTLASLYFALPAVAASLLGSVMVPGGGILGRATQSTAARWTLTALSYMNPFYAMGETTTHMLSPGPRPSFRWPVHCLVLFVLASLILGVAVLVVRGVALRQATGQIDLSLRPRRRRKKRRANSAQAAEPVSEGPVKRVVGPPIVWKELRAPFIQGVNSRNSYIGLAITIAALGVTYWLTARQKILDDTFAHIAYGLLFVLMGIVFCVVFSATRITVERESQTWPLLLTTALGDRDILLGKAFSSFRRCVPIWALLAGHVVLFVLVGYIHPIALVHILLLIAWLTCFVVGMGLYFGTRFARTTSSVVASFALVLGLWAVGPILIGILDIGQARPDSLIAYMWFHPVEQIRMIMGGGSGLENARRSLHSLTYRSHTHSFGAGRMTALLAGTGLVYVVSAFVFYWRAKRRLRRSAF